MINVFYDPDNSYLRSQTLQLMGYFFLIGVVTGFCQWFQPYLFSITGEKLTRALRAELFDNLIRQQISFFDDEVRDYYGTVFPVVVRVRNEPLVGRVGGRAWCFGICD